MKDKKTISTSSEHPVTEEQKGRRKLLTALSGAGAITLLPSEWKKPLVKSVVMPAHAQTSVVEASGGGGGGGGAVVSAICNISINYTISAIGNIGNGDTAGVCAQIGLGGPPAVSTCESATVGQDIVGGIILTDTTPGFYFMEVFHDTNNSGASFVANVNLVAGDPPTTRMSNIAAPAGTLSIQDFVILNADSTCLFI